MEGKPKVYIGLPGFGCENHSQGVCPVKDDKGALLRSSKAQRALRSSTNNYLSRLYRETGHSSRWSSTAPRLAARFLAASIATRVSRREESLQYFTIVQGTIPRFVELIAWYNSPGSDTSAVLVLYWRPPAHF
jgi:hypothetical protein